MKYGYLTQGTCARFLTFELDGDTLSHIEFLGGCNGNLKAVALLLEGTSADRAARTLRGNHCGNRPTSCTDQLAQAIELALSGELAPLEEEEENI